MRHISLSALALCAILYAGLSGAAAQKLPAVGVYRPDLPVARNIFTSEGCVGQVTDIVYREAGAAGHPQTWICGSGGSVAITTGGAVMSRLRFPDKCGPCRMVDIESDGSWEYASRGFAWQPVYLLDGTGHRRWKFAPEGNAVNSMAAGDIDGDGKCEFVAAMNAGGLAVLDDKGRKTLDIETRGRCGHVEVLDIDGDGTAEIVHDRHWKNEHSFQIRRSDGTLVKDCPVGRPMNNFSLVEWPSPGGARHIIFDDEEQKLLRLYDMDGKMLMTFPAPRPLATYGIYAATVRFSEGGGSNLAVLFWLRYRAYSHEPSNDRSALHIYDDAGNLVYIEVLGENCMSVGQAPGPGEGMNQLLVGGTGRVYSYSIPGEVDRGGRPRPGR